MSASAQERYVRRPISLPERARARRTADERLIARAPGLYRALAFLALSRSPRSYLRTIFLDRAARGAFAAYNRRDFELVLAAFDPEIEFHPAAAGLIDVEGVYRGHQALRRFWRLWLEAWDEFQFEPVELIDFPKRTLFLLKVRARAGGSGVEAPHTLAMLSTYRRGAIVRHEEWWEWSEALEAVGLRR